MIRLEKLRFARYVHRIVDRPGLNVCDFHCLGQMNDEELTWAIQYLLKLYFRMRERMSSKA